MARADKYTLEQKKFTVYSDFLMNFDKNPFTGYLGMATNEDAVKNSMRQLLLTNKGERFFDSRKGAGIRDMLFELFDPSTHEAIKYDIKTIVEAYEPRAIIQNIEIEQLEDDNSIFIKIVFSIRNIQEEAFVLDLHVERVR
jgi:phage baseplate assembly protein W